MKFADQGHIITVAGPASGKFTNFIAPNLLGTSNYTGSWFVIDVKGEAFSVTEEYQKSTGRQVIVLNPWNLIKNSDATYNPLDLINVNDEESLVDDASIIAQMIVPSEKGDHDPYWRNRARSFITGLIIHLLLQKDTVKDEVLVEKAEEKTLTTIWKWLRLQEKDFIKLLTKMSLNQNEVASGAANELISIQGSDKAYSSILSAAQDATDFLKSPSLQRSLKTSNFNINELSNGNTCLYVVIPADKLESQSQWLRLIVATSLLSVVRNKDKQVTFVLDEFAALGHMEIVQRYMGLARGYNVSLWPILQSLPTIEKHLWRWLGNIYRGKRGTFVLWNFGQF